MADRTVRFLLSFAAVLTVSQPAGSPALTPAETAPFDYPVESVLSAFQHRYQAAYARTLVLPITSGEGEPIEFPEPGDAGLDPAAEDPLAPLASTIDRIFFSLFVGSTASGFKGTLAHRFLDEAAFGRLNNSRNPVAPSDVFPMTVAESGERRDWRALEASLGAEEKLDLSASRLARMRYLIVPLTVARTGRRVASTSDAVGDAVSIVEETVAALPVAYEPFSGRYTSQDYYSQNEQRQGPHSLSTC